MRILSIFGIKKNEEERLICFSILNRGLKVGDEIEFGNQKYLITRIARLNKMVYQSKNFPLLGVYGLKSKEDIN